MHGQKAIHKGGCPECYLMKLKIDANGNVVVQDGKPVYGKRLPTDVLSRLVI